MKSIWIYLVGFLISTMAFADDAAQQLIVMRHGEARNNVKHVYNSNPDHLNYKPAKLTSKGKKQVKLTAKILREKGFNNKNIAAVFVSPLPRTLQTAEILAKKGLFSKAKIRIDQRLIEIQAGDLEGKKIFHPWEQSYVKEYRTESEKHVAERVQDFYDSIVNQFPQGNIMVITHMIVAEDLIQIVTGQDVQLGLAEAIVIPLEAVKSE